MVQFARDELARGTAAVHSSVGTYTGNTNADWCCSFCCWVYRNATGKDPKWGSSEHGGKGKNETWVPDMVLWAQESGLWLRNRDIHSVDRRGKAVPNASAANPPKPGYLVVYGDTVNLFGGFNRQNYPHIGLLTSVNGSSLKSIEGNTRNADGFAGHIAAKTPNPTLLPASTMGSLARYVAGYVIPPA